jgi:signal transduction histidine kinase
MSNSIQSNFSKERKQTDTSLMRERGKTDESFQEGRSKSQSETDVAVTQKRLEADEARVARRISADLKRATKSDDLTHSQLSPRTVYRELTKQRILDDAAIDRERTYMDCALRHERIEKQHLMNKLVCAERKATDKNLSVERTAADIEADRSADLLNVEQSAHLQTKSTLTTREEFVAIVSHDLRNPVGAILSASALLLEGAEEMGLSADGISLVQMVQRNAKTSLRLITDILDMERIVEDKISLDVDSVSITNLIEEALETNSHIANSKNISFQGTLSNREQIVVCDRDRIAQVLSNLIGNALKFTPEGGTVRVTMKEEEEVIQISVIDTGPGIPNDQTTRIFERFAQLGKQDRSGIGLGLYISKSLIESHGGSLDVASSPLGSIFSFTLPKSGPPKD